KPLGFGGGKMINTSNIRPYYIHFLSLIQKNPISVSLTLVTVSAPITYLITLFLRLNKAIKLVEAWRCM
ncbi:MAG TPA: hypothetical protein VJ919_11820, partial [Tangfeifania sp.]|nr:hypothetical protein [Tangfeifania sp.]